MAQQFKCSLKPYGLFFLHSEINLKLYHIIQCFIILFVDLKEIRELHKNKIDQKIFNGNVLKLEYWGKMSLLLRKESGF